MPHATSPRTPKNPRALRGEHLRAVAMPLGGIGAGQIALAGDGGWRQWQIHNVPNHLGHVPHSFFAVRMRPQSVHFTKRRRAEDTMGTMRVLQSAALYDDAEFVGPVTSSDHMVPEESRKLLSALRGVAEIEFLGEYPVAEVTYRDPALPVPVKLTAFSPFSPLDEELSGLPAIVCRLSVANATDTALHVALAATLQNAVGWDGLSGIAGAHNVGYGGNVNRVVRTVGLTAVDMTSTRLPRDHRDWGQMTLSALHDDATALGRWDSLEGFAAAFDSAAGLGNLDDPTPSEAGATVNGALARNGRVEPGETFEATFVISWYFPNAEIHWDQKGFGLEDRKTRFYLGTRYAARFASAYDVARHVCEHVDELTDATFRYREAFYGATLPPAILDAVGSQVSIIRSPTCIWLEDGDFHAFEGCHGASTGSPEQTGGCCPLDCNHVWNYEQALARLFPHLERAMRRTDLKHQQAEDGRLGHRTLLPLYLPRWTVPATDGQLGEVLKVYREYRAGGGCEFLDEFWPATKRALEWIMRENDPDGDGVVANWQPHTYDCPLHGANTFIGSLYLAALRAAEEMARIVGEGEFADECRRRFDSGTKRADELLWNGEFWVQKPEPDKDMKWQYGEGCHVDQLAGQWWARMLDLGDVLPREHVRTALASIVRHNFREDFVDFEQKPRIYCSPHDSGLVICTWPNGGRPAEPTLYSDEVWPGTEYEIAAQLLYEGMTEEALRIVEATRARYDGRERNPWNEVECGDHYARSLASWSVLEAATGFRYDHDSASVSFAPKIDPNEFRAPFVAADGYGTYEQNIARGKAICTISLVSGTLRLRTLEIDLPRSVMAVETVSVDGKTVAFEASADGNRATVRFAGKRGVVASKSVAVGIATGSKR